MKMCIFHVTNPSNLCLQLLVFYMQFMQGCHMYKECLLQTPAISHSQNIGIEKYYLYMPAPGTCQHYGKFWHCQKYRIMARKRPMNQYLNFCTPFKQSTDGDIQGKREQCWPQWFCSGEYFSNVSANRKEAKIMADQSQALSIYPLLAGHQPLDFKFRFFYLLPDCKLSNLFLTQFPESHKRYLRLGLLQTPSSIKQPLH